MKKRIVVIVFTVLMMLLAAPAVMNAVPGAIDLDGSLNFITGSAAQHKHKYTSKVTKKATCTKSGVRTYTCKCGDSYTKKIAATGHKDTKTVKAKAATCTKAGYTKGVYCNDCKTYISGHKTVKATGHKYDNACDKTCNVCKNKRTIKHSYKAATCTTAKTCKVCGATSGKALGHSYSTKYTTDKKATCTAAGSKSRHCTRDGCTAKTEVTAIKKTGHKYTNSCDKTCNTCKAKRTIKHTYTNDCDKSCNVCKATRTTKHSYKAATCTKPKTCKICGATSGKALGHKYTNACDKTCNTCKATRKITHDYTAATCTAPKTCKICAATSGNALGHTEVTDAAVAATCTKTGKTEGKHCTVCGEVTVAQKTVAAKGHTIVTDKAVAATCTKAGKTEGKHCAVCGEVTVAQKTVAAKGHTLATDKAVAATCTKSGKTEGKHCTVCGEVTVAQKTVAAKGHTIVTVKAVAATCMKAGKTEGKYCSVCETVTVKQETIEKKAHTLTSDKKVAATCTTAGKTAGKHCVVCGTVTVKQETIPATGHTLVTDKAVEATCTKAGKTEGKHCSVCGTVTVKQETIAAGHKIVTDKAVAATCTKAGKTEGKHCSVCEEVLTAQKTVAAKGHQYNMTNPAAATKCSGCSETIPAFNDIVNKLKNRADGINYYTAILKDQNDYGKTEVSGSMAESMGEDLSPSSETKYGSLVVNRAITDSNFFTKNESFVSALTSSDIKSIKLQKVSGVDFVSELPSSITVNKRTYDISSVKSAKFPEVYKISVTLPTITVSDITKKISGSSPYDKIYAKNYNSLLEELRVEMVSQFKSLENELASLGIFKMKTSGNIKSDLVVDYYITTDDFTPVAAKYALKYDINLNIKVTDLLGISNLVTMKQPMSMTSSAYYFFNESFDL